MSTYDKSNKFFMDRGYTPGTFETYLSQFGITPSKSKSGSNVNQKEYGKYLADYSKSLEENPASVLPSYGRMEAGFGEAKKYFSDMLTSLQPRYQSLIDQLAGEQKVAQEKNVQMSGAESTTLKKELAKRGLSTAASDTYASGEYNKLGALQDTRSRETDLAFSRERLATNEAQTAEEERLNTNLSNLTVDQVKTLNDVLNVEKSRIAQAIEGGVATGTSQKSMQIQAEQWEKNFSFLKDKDAADRALEYYRLAKSKSAAQGDKDYAKSLLSVVENAYKSSDKFPNMRELIQDQLSSAFPEKKTQIADDIKKYFPDGWEWQGQQYKTSNKSIAPEVQKIMDALQVDEQTATLLLRQEAGL